MGYSVVIGGGDPIPLATIHGWKLAKEWIDSLVPEYRELHALSGDGVSNDARELADELDDALIDAEPDASVTKTLEELLDSLEGVEPGTSIFVTDGMAEDDGEPEDFHPGYEPDEL